MMTITLEEPACEKLLIIVINLKAFTKMVSTWSKYHN